MERNSRGGVEERGKGRRKRERTRDSKNSQGKGGGFAVLESVERRKQSEIGLSDRPSSLSLNSASARGSKLENFTPLAEVTSCI